MISLILTSMYSTLTQYMNQHRSTTLTKYTTLNCLHNNNIHKLTKALGNIEGHASLISNVKIEKTVEYRVNVWFLEPYVTMKWARHSINHINYSV